MKRAFALVSMLLASLAMAQGAPAVDESSGAVGYSYVFGLPGARGQYQPSLALLYSSQASGNVGYGVAWQLSESFVERNPIARHSTGTTQRNEYILSLNGSASLMLPVGGPPFGIASTSYEYRPEAGSAYFALRYQSTTQWQGTDDRGNTYQFTCLTSLCNRWYLTRVTDPSGNVSVLEYDIEATTPAAATSAARLKAIRYNAYDPSAPTSTSAVANPTSFATHIELTYEQSTSSSPILLALRQVAGSMVEYKHRLTGVAVRNQAPTGRTTVLSYLLAYLDAESKGELLGSITEWGGATPTLRGRRTSFTYGAARLSNSTYSLAAATSFTKPATFDSPTWLDVDADGLPDLVQNGQWVRNVTPTGGSTLLFENSYVRAMPNFVTPLLWRDVNGDGIQDLVRTNVSGACGTMPNFVVRFGALGAGRNIQFGADVCFNAQAPNAFWQSLYGGTSGVNLTSLSAALTDITGDGVADLVISSSSGWNVFRGYWDSSSAGWGFTSNSLFGGATGSPGDSDTASQVRLTDLNADGLPDHVRVSSGTWTVGLNATDANSFSADRAWTWYSGLALPGPAAGLYEGVSARNSCPYGDVSGALYEVLEGTNKIALRDLNGDGLPDHVRFSGTSSVQVAWNTGKGFIAGPTFSMIHYPVSRYHSQSHLCETADGTTLYYASHSTGADGNMADLNGDGVVDYATLAAASSTLGFKFQKGSNGARAGAVFAMTAVIVPDGAWYVISYDAATIAAAGDGRILAQRVLPVAAAIEVSGPAMEWNKVSYAYADMRVATAWHDPGQPEVRGFRESWSWDDVSRIVRHTVRETDSHAFAGGAVKVELGALVAPGNPPSFTVFAATDAVFAARGIASAGCVAATNSDPSCGARKEPPSASYPVVAFGAEERSTRWVSGLQFVSRSWIPLADAASVDAYGNVWKRYGDPDTAVADDEVFLEQLWANGTCKACPMTMKWKNPVNSTVLKSELFEYTAAGLLIREKYAESGVTRVYHGNGNLGSIIAAGVTTSYMYDEPHQLRLTKTQIGPQTGGSKVLVTDYGYDDTTGRLALTSGPYVFGSSSPIQSRALAYDLLGRVVATARSPISGSTVTNAVQAVVYDDTADVRSVKTYTFGAARSFTLGGTIPDGDDVSVRIVYRDGLGRSVQARERLGSGLPAHAGTGVIQALSGFKVTGNVILDGAGRARVTLEPFYAASPAFQDYRSSTSELVTAAASTSGLRGVVVSYDAEGRVVCSLNQFVDGALPASPGPAQCTSVPSAQDASFKLATRYEYLPAQRRGQGPWFMAVRTTPPESGATTTLSDASGRVAWTVDALDNGVFILRDRLGRERATGREPSSGSGSSLTTSTYYDGSGRVSYMVDPSWGTRRWGYDSLGRIVTVGLEQNWSSITTKQIKYSYGDLNRLTKVEHISDDGDWYYDGDEDVWISAPTVLKSSTFGYDSAYAGDTVSYGYVAGRRAWEANAEATIAYGYDQDGRPNRRDEWLLGITGRLSSGATYRDDGIAKASSFGLFGSGGTDPAPLDYSASFDSAGRVVKVSSASTSFLDIPGAGSGGFDALGRTTMVQADDSRATSTRAYSRWTGQLTSEAKSLPGADFFSVSHTLYQGSQLRTATDTVNQVSYTNTYDASGRVERSWAETDIPCAPLAQEYDETYGFALNKQLVAGASLGNLERVSESKTTCPGGTAVSNTTDAQYNYPAGKDQVASLTAYPTSTVLASYGYDARGRLTSRNGTAETFAYDLEDRLEKITRQAGQSETLAYGPSGELVRRQVGATVTFYVGDAATVTGTLPGGCAVPSATCNVTPASLNVDAHVVVGGTRIASVSSSRTLFYYRDRKGSVIATSVKGSSVGAQYRYTPYGALDKVVGETPTNASELGYIGAVKLTGELLYLRARVYDPNLKRFLSADSVDIYRYTYGRGDPVNFSDPSGQRRISDWQRGDPEGLSAFYGSSGLGGLLPPSSFVADVPWLARNTSNPLNMAALIARTGSLNAALKAMAQAKGNLPSTGNQCAIGLSPFSHYDLGNDVNGIHGDAYTSFDGTILVLSTGHMDFEAMMYAGGRSLGQLSILIGGGINTAALVPGIDASFGAYYKPAGAYHRRFSSPVDDGGTYVSMGRSYGGINISADFFGGITWAPLTGQTRNYNYSAWLVSVTQMTDPVSGKLIGITAGVGPGSLPVGFSVSEPITKARSFLGPYVTP